MTIKSEKARLYQWLLMTLASGKQLCQRLETQAAAQEIEQELKDRFADLVHANRKQVVNFAAEPEKGGEE